MIDALADICRNNLYKDKLLLVPTYAIGQNIIDMLSEKTPVLILISVRNVGVYYVNVGDHMVSF